MKKRLPAAGWLRVAGAAVGCRRRKVHLPGGWVPRRLALFNPLAHD
jgi:hypothetical protein